MPKPPILLTEALTPPPALVRAGLETLPAIIRGRGERASRRFIEFFTANRNTRDAYARALKQFLDWCEDRRLELQDIDALSVAAYVEQLGSRTAKPTVKQHLAAIKQLFAYLTSGGILEVNPAASVRGPKYVVRRGKTPVLSAAEARQLLDSIESDFNDEGHYRRPVRPSAKILFKGLWRFVNPTTFALESCSTSGVLALPQSYLATGAITLDNEGNSCAAFTQVLSDLPVDASPPIVTANEHTVGKALNYDSTTGTGDGSFTAYTGGSCNGVTFDSTGATIVSNGTTHFVVTDDGKRIDFLFSALTNSTDSIGDFSLSGTYLKQTR